MIVVEKVQLRKRLRMRESFDGRRPHRFVALDQTWSGPVQPQF